MVSVSFLKLVASATYVTVVVLLVTVAWYTMLFARHCKPYNNISKKVT